MPESAVRVVGRYSLHGELASGGMATVHFGRLMGPVGFARTVAIKRLHAQFAKDPEFVSMFLDEARLAARIQHPNVAATLDVVATQGELFLVMEYLQGESLSRLMRNARDTGRTIDPRVASTILSGTLHGLHAAHEAKNERGEALGIVHRDISPQNVLVGQDGVPRVLDFGVAKAAGRFHTTREGNVKGKLPYMSPEQLRGGNVDRRTDTYAAAVVLWETLTCRKLFRGDNEGAVLEAVLMSTIEPPSKLATGISAELDALVLKGLDRDPTKRFQTAREFALALERCVAPALTSDVGEWVQSVAGEVLTKRAEAIAEIESFTGDLPLMTEVLQGIADSSSASPAIAPSQAQASLDGSPSQVSSISVAHVTRPPPPKRGVLVAVGSVAAALLLVGVTVLLVRGSAQPTTTAAPLPNSAPTPTPSATQAAPTITAVAPATGTASAAPTTTPTASAVVKVPGPVRTAQPQPTAAAQPTHKAIDCDPPFKIGANGVKIYKPECIK